MSLPNGSEIFATGVTTFLVVKDHYTQFTTLVGGDLHHLLLVNITTYNIISLPKNLQIKILIVKYVDNTMSYCSSYCL